MPTTTRSTLNWNSGSAAAPAARARPCAQNAELSLANNVARGITAGERGVDVVVLEGMVLLTDGDDHVLRAGEAFHAERAGNPVVLSLRPSRIRVVERC